MIKKLISEKTGLILLYAGFFATIISIILFLWANYTLQISEPIDADRFAKFGEFVGGVVGSLWTLASVILFYVALTEQRKSSKESQTAITLQIDALNKQLEEFTAQRKEIELTRKIYEIQTKTIRTQQFESNFYSLIDIYLKIKNNLNQNDDQKDYFLSTYQKLLDACKSVSIFQQFHAEMTKQYEISSSTNSSHLSHYFKSFYRIVEVIDVNSTFNDEEKMFYIKILRSQISDYEILILYYNSQSNYGVNSRGLILKYNLFKDSPLFFRPPFDRFLVKQGNNDLSLFSDRLSQFLLIHLPYFYAMDSELDKFEETFEFFKCIVGIYFYENIELKIYLNKDIKTNGVNLSDSEFIDFLFLFVYDKIIQDNYIDGAGIEISKFTTNTDNVKIFGVLIKTNLMIRLNKDIF